MAKVIFEGEESDIEILKSKVIDKHLLGIVAKLSFEGRVYKICFTLNPKTFEIGNKEGLVLE